MTGYSSAMLRAPSFAPVRTRSTVGPRDLSRHPRDPAALGFVLAEVVEAAAAKGPPRPAILGFSGTHVEQHDLPPLVAQKADIHRFIAAVAGQEGMEAVAVVGTLGVRKGRGEAQPGLVVFIEWPDGAWWLWARPLRDRAIRDDLPPEIRAAWDGWPRPSGLGGFWTRARVEGLRLQRETVDGADELVN